VATQLAFAVFSLVVILASWRVVTSPDVARAAVALVVALAGMAPLFLLLAAEFVAVVQVLVYVGAVVVLFLFAVMLTARRGDGVDPVDHHRRWPGLLTASVLLVVLLRTTRDAFGDAEVGTPSIGRTAAVGDVMLRQHVVAFEAASVLLLAALVGAIVLARKG